MNKYKYRILKNGNGKYKIQIKESFFWAPWGTWGWRYEDCEEDYHPFLYDTYEEAEEGAKEAMSKTKEREEETKRNLRTVPENFKSSKDQFCRLVSNFCL